MRVAFYLRVSTDDQTTDNQLPELHRYAEFHKWDVAETYVDKGISGRKTSRPAFDRMMADARARRFDVVCVVKLDRLGRSTQHLLAILSELEKLGIGFASVTQGLDTTNPAGRLLFTVLAAMAEFESSLIVERTRAGLRNARSNGKTLGRSVSINREQVKRLRSEGRTQAAIATELGIHVNSVRRVERAA
jgi:DNA invertase Pin-like site-specific DNA recombinase